MSNSSWRKFGGKNVLINETINVGTVVATQFLTRTTSSTTNTFDNINVLGEAHIHNDATLFADLYVKHNEYISNNLYINNKLLFGIDISNNINPYAYMAGNKYNIGVNTLTPSTLFHVTGNATNVLTVDTDSAIIRNIIGQNVNKKGVVIQAEDNYSNIYFYNDSTTDINNVANGYLRYKAGGYLTVSSITAIDLSSANITSHFGRGIMHFDDDNALIQTPGSVLIDTNNILINSTNNFLFSYTNDNIPSSAILLNQEGILFNTLNDFHINSTGGTVSSTYNNSIGTVKLSSTNIELSANIVASTTGIYNSINGETFTVYDSSNSIYLFNVYDNSSSYTGKAITMVSQDNSSNTQARIIAPNNMGMTMIGGVFPNDTTRSMGTYGLLDISGDFIPSYIALSGKDPKKYYSTMGINTYTPKTESYILDINGPTHIGNGEINTKASVDFEIKYMKFSKINVLSGIAVGTPKTIFGNITEDNTNNQYILYTKDGGITWNTSEVGSGFLSIIPDNTFTSLYVYDQSFAVVGTTQSQLFYTYNGGENWNTLVYDNNSISARTTYALSISKPTNSNYYNVMMIVKFLNPNYKTSPYYYYRYIINKYQVELNSIINLYETNYKNTVNQYTPYQADIGLIDSFINGDCGNNYVFFVGSNGICQFPLTNTGTINIPNTPNSYNGIYVYNDDNVIAVGKNKISYTTNATKVSQSIWTTVSTPSTNMNLQSVFIYDLSNAVAVGDNGAFIYTTNWSGGEWKTVPIELLNSSGIADRISGANLKGINMYDINTFVISNVNTSYNENIKQLGQSQILFCYFPNIFNRVNNSLLDISGNMIISGDININDSGEIISNNPSFNILQNSKVKQINIGNNKASTAIIGNLYIGNDISLNSRLFVYGDASYNSNLGILGNISIFNNKTIYANNYDVNTAVMSSNINIGNIAGNIYIGNNITGGKTIQIGTGGQNAIKAITSNNIYIGGQDDNVVIYGNTKIVNMTETKFMIPLLKLNCAQSGYTSNTATTSIDQQQNQKYFNPGAGITIKDLSNNYAGYMLVSYDTSGYYFKAPGSDNVVNFNIGTLKNPSGIPTQLNLSNNIKNGILVLSSDSDKQNRANYGITVKEIDISNVFLRDSTYSTNTFQQIFTNVGVSGDITIINKSRLYVYGDVSLNSRLYVNSDVSINQRLFVSKDVSFNNNLYVANSVCIDTSGNESLYNLDVSGSINFRGIINPINLIDNSVLLTNTPALDFSNNFCNIWMTNVNAPQNNWTSIAMCANGIFQTAIVSQTGIYTSTNYGINWQKTNSGNYDWKDIALSSDGKIQMAVAKSANIYYSTDYGNNWNSIAYSSASSLYNLINIAISGNGQFISAIGYNYESSIYSIAIIKSINGGISFNTVILNSNQQGFSNTNNCSISMSTTGQYQVCCIYSTNNTTNIYVSNNYGESWSGKSIIDSKYLNCVCISSSGKYIYVGSSNNNNYIFISTDYGNTFSTSFHNTSYSYYFNNIAVSANGQYIIAISNNSTYQMLSSINYGNSWNIITNTPSQYVYLNSIAMSANGQYLTVCSTNNIYNSVTPYINMSISNNLIIYSDASFNSRIFIGGPVTQF